MNVPLLKIEPIGVSKRHGLDIDQCIFSDNEVRSILLFKLTILTTIHNSKQRKRVYLIELHSYKGYAMVKFYPKKHKNDSQKYKLRSKEIGYSLSVTHIKKILFDCALVMKQYLDRNPENFIGYIGQTDDKDNLPNKMREFSQRSAIYHLYTASMFLVPKYCHSSKELFGKINLALVRRIMNKKQEFTLTNTQKINYDSFLKYLDRKEKEGLLLEFMTAKTKHELSLQI